jgi:uncharacterized protein YqcC (DUF446 family)
MSTPDTHTELAAELMELEAGLRNLRLWSHREPTARALASTEPFACDTLAFTEWLQFIFVPRLYSLAETGAPLPEKCDVTPMAEEYFKANAIEARVVIRRLWRIDRLVTEAS